MSNLINVVPTLAQITDPVVAAQTAHFTYRGGPLLSNVDVYTIFWGTPWQQSSYQFMANNLNTFFKNVVASTLLAQLQEYSAGSYQIGQGTFAGTTTLTQPKLPPSFFGHSLVTDGAIQNMLLTATGNKTLPPPTSNRLYFVFLPAGYTVIQNFAAAVTDAVPGQGWYDDTYGEIGDICAWKTKNLGPYLIQREWSQKNTACT